MDSGAYLGSGSAEWSNWARAVVALQPVPGTAIYRLSAPKRGSRLRWRDDKDRPVYHCFIAHAREPGVICWRDADPEETQAIGPAQAKEGYQRLVEVFRTAEEASTGLPAEEIIRRAVEERITTACDVSRIRRLWLTGKGARAIMGNILEPVDPESGTFRPVGGAIPR